MVSYVLSFIMVSSVAFAAVAKQDLVHEQKLSDKEPGSPEYDHEAFLGKEDAQEFNELSPDESKRRLGVIVGKIDNDNDGQVTEEELKKWISFTQSRYIQEDTNKQFAHHDTDGNGVITWDEYKNSAYGMDFGENEENKDEYEKMISRDKKRFDTADADGNSECTLDEFRAFLHPEEFDHMKGVVTQETMDEIDKNKDGFVDIDEYVGDMVHEDGEEPDWVSSEREQFHEYRDTNKDGKLDLEEVRSWIMPDDYNHAEAEAKHLIYEADDNKDGMLSKDEILGHHDTFVGSQATDWGEALKRHDEF